jgi:hypothetical protein
VLPTQLCPSGHGGAQTDGPDGSGSAAPARAAAPASASVAISNASPGRRSPAPARVPERIRHLRFEPERTVSQAGYDSASVSLRAPIAVPVEIRAPKRRLFRLAAAVGEDGIRLARGAPFEPGRPVDVRFRLPEGDALALTAIVTDGDAADDEIAFVDPPADARQAIRRYVHGRLGLPGMST